ncbi:MAG TPA: tetratricopeptide repeat protein [Bacteroidia bacterium]|nr:tetratricopeptide repeat protein [Bacteroidia bacterium]
MFQRDTWISPKVVLSKDDSVLIEKETTYTQALKLNPKNAADLYYKRANVRYEMGKKHVNGDTYVHYKRANKDFSKAIELNSAKYNTDTVYYMEGQCATLYYLSRAAYSNNVNYTTNSWGSLAAAPAGSGGNPYRKAINYFTKAIKLNPNYADAYFERGQCMYSMSKKREAIEDYTKAIKLNTRYAAEAFYQRALCKFDLKDKDGGCTDLSNAFSLGYKQDRNVYDYFGHNGCK